MSCDERRGEMFGIIALGLTAAFIAGCAVAAIGLHRPSADALLLEKARAFLEAGDPARAEHYARQAIEANPSNAEAVQFAKTLTKRGG